MIFEILINLKSKNKGQAAITDALFFLTIIVTLSVLLFRFSSTYGDRIDLATSNLYFKEYSNSAMKTIFYTEVPLDFSQEINESTLEVDYLMTSIKSDFYIDGVIGDGGDTSNHSGINNLAVIPQDIQKFNLYHTIKAVMNPLPTYDYLFYLYNVSDGRFEYVLIKINKYTLEENPSNLRPYEVNYNPENTISTYYLCNPLDYEKIRNLVSKVNRVYASSIPLLFVHNGISKEINSTFAIWASTPSITPEELNAENLNCKEINDEELDEDIINYITNYMD